MKRHLQFLLTASGLAVTAAASANYTVTVNAIDQNGVGKEIGQVAITTAKSGGVVFAPNLKSLPPGEHGFHVHDNASCEVKDKEGKIEAGEAAGGHYDPKHSDKHAGPAGDGHLGDLPALHVDASGNATKAVTAPRLKLAEIKGHSLMIHAGGDTNSDQPAPNGAGGARIACGLIK